MTFDHETSPNTSEFSLFIRKFMRFSLKSSGSLIWTFSLSGLDVDFKWWIKLSRSRKESESDLRSASWAPPSHSQCYTVWLPGLKTSTENTFTTLNWSGAQIRNSAGIRVQFLDVWEQIWCVMKMTCVLPPQLLHCALTRPQSCLQERQLGRQSCGGKEAQFVIFI